MFRSTCYFCFVILSVLSLPLLIAEETEAKPQAVLKPQQVITLWPEGTPGSTSTSTEKNTETVDQRIGRKVTKVVTPELAWFPAPEKKRTGAAVVICPGGGYHILAYDLEGVEVALWLNGIGVDAFVLKYRVPRVKDAKKHVAPLQDSQRAMSYVRHHASKLKIDPKRIGLMGFSAGGHLTATTGTHFTKPSYSAVDEIDKASSRPDFLMLIYPAYLTGGKEEPVLSAEVPVTKETPPTLMIHAGDDRVTALSSVAFYLALKKNKVPAEIHIYPTGGHGYGLRPTTHAVTSWPHVAERWMKTMKVLSDKEKSSEE